MLVFLLHFGGVELERGNHVGFSAFQPVPIGSPGTFLHDFLFRAAGFVRRQHHLFHHLPNHAVGEYHGGRAVFEGEAEGEVHEVCHFLHRGRCEHNHVVVAVAAAARGLVVVALRGLDSAEARAAALHVHDQAGYFRARHIADAFLHQRHAGTRRGGHHALARAAASVEHVDARHLALRLQHHHTRGFPRLECGKRFEHLALRRNGIAEIAVATAAYGGVGYGFIAFEQEYFVFFFHSLLKKCM